MPSILRLLLLLLFCLALNSCDDGPKPGKKDRHTKDDFFDESKKAESLDTLQNELNRGETKLLKRFAVDPIPWQKWDASILEKARARQAPIFLYIVSGLSEDSRSIAVEISERESLRDILMDKSVCAVADIQINPELGILAHHLAAEINQPAAFPTLLWMSHEGAPIAWLPISRTTGRKLEIVINSSAAMVDDIWTKDSKYAVSNSQMDNSRRQERFDNPPVTGNEVSRNEAFLVGTRKTSALYSEIDKNIDHTGGLLPASSLELLSIGSLRTDFTSQIRKKCKTAVTEVSKQLITEALKDQLDGSYFYARRSVGWSLPVFSKNLETQTKMARFFLNGGIITKNQAMINEGRQLLDVITRDWLSKPQSFIAPLSNPDREGSFIFDQDSLKKALDENELELAKPAYSLESEGNIPGSVDPLGIYYQKNTLRRKIPLAEIAAKSGQSEEEVSQRLTQIQGKLLAHRLKITEFLSEPLISAGDFSRIIRAQVAGAQALDEPSFLTEALKNGALLRKNYSHPSDGLSRFPIDSCQCPPRSKDYSLCALAALDLYQATLDPEWLQWSISIMDEALLKLSRGGQPLREVPKSESIIPLAIHNRSMIFSDSSVGTSHAIFLQLSAITGKERFTEMADLTARDLSRLSVTAPVNHSDFLISCARGDSPLVAVVHGRDSAEGQNLLKTLNSPHFLPFINIRGDEKIDSLKELPASAETGVSIYRGN
ncbi:DUF255 domain-containing protein, partial [Akkermansiaceae bacterium]|nr:DUF255 domain-containing protein [Akkermansiaceae bacterium]